MGSFMSSFFGGGGEADPDEEGSSHVQAFHSFARWQLHLNSLSQTPQLMVVDFAASWCGPCKLMEPTVHSLASKFPGVSFAKIDVDELSDVAREFGVQAMPTFVLMKKGKEIARVVGAKKQELESLVQRHHTASCVQKTRTIL
ncbi:hypothetical protein MLD38_033919 [Melastoma candidum]|uniref:Uncharacterized protein n=1 Tax=Melastoma candidum TaxID=119954 RepID=A0ACB9M891_9MYRT|nr:hypothetical protein MLD38_033919 [Melastoma candidum]